MVRTLNTDKRPKERSRIAVIGLGMSGATCCHFLSKKHDVVGIESQTEAGLHVHSVNRGDFKFDMPLRAISPHYYPNLSRMYRYLGLELMPVNYQNTGVDVDNGESYFRYWNLNIGPWALSFPVLSFAGLLTIFLIVRDYMWFVFATPWELYWAASPHQVQDSQNFDSSPHDDEATKGGGTKRGGGGSGRSNSRRTAAGSIHHETLGQFLNRRRYSKEFVHRFFLPVMSTLLSCSYEQVLEYPANFIAEFYCSRGTAFFARWHRVKEGAIKVSEKLLEGVPCHYGARVEYIRRSTDGNSVIIKIASQATPLEFDHVVLCVEPNVIPYILSDADVVEKTLAGAVDYFSADIVAHSDAALMPEQRGTWSGLNYFSSSSQLSTSWPRCSMSGCPPVSGAGLSTSPCRETSSEAVASTSSSVAPIKSTASPVASSPPRTTPGGAGMLRHLASMTSAHLNRFAPYPLPPSQKNVFETWNPYSPPKEGTVIKEVRMTRAVWTVPGRDRFEAVSRIAQGARRVWFAGSYASPGVTLLEQAVHSALDVALDMGVELPFEVEPTYGQYRGLLVLAAFLHVIAKVWDFFLVLLRLR